MGKTTRKQEVRTEKDIGNGSADRKITRKQSLQTGEKDNQGEAESLNPGEKITRGSGSAGQQCNQGRVEMQITMPARAAGFNS